MASRTYSRALAAAALAAALAAFFAGGGARYLSFESLKAQQAALAAAYHANPWRAALGFFALYVAYTGFSLPGAGLLSLVAGAVFGLLGGTVLVSFASTLGATIAFLVARFLLRDWVQQRFAGRLAAINRGVARDGAFYLFLLRLTPAVPFFLINLAMGLTPMRAATFYWVSQLGMLAGTVVYVNAGTQLASLASPRDVLSWPLAGALLALGFFPLAAKKAGGNLFGTFSVAIDQPFREGDTIRVDGIEGVVETVGLRSTRIRTADRTVIAIPNGKLADMRVETISRQDRLRFYCSFGVAHGTSEALERLVQEIKSLLASEALVDQTTIGVRFVGLTDAGLNLEIGAMLATTEGAKFMDAKERLLLGIVRCVEHAGARLAHPSRTIELVPTPEKESAAEASASNGSSNGPRGVSASRSSPSPLRG